MFVRSCSSSPYRAAAVLYARVVRPWQLTWGATPEEVSRHLPGDEWHHRDAVTAALCGRPGGDRAIPFLRRSEANG